MISAGMTTLEQEPLAYRLNVDLAADIAKTFSGIDVKLPGLGTDKLAPLDFALAMPVKELRSFWMAQADAVAAKPFTCPALTELNAGLRQAAHDGAKDRGAAGQRPARHAPDAGQREASRRRASRSRKRRSPGRVLIASDNPEGMLAMAQMAAPAVGTAVRAKDGKPVALPTDVTGKMTGGPGLGRHDRPRARPGRRVRARTTSSPATSRNRAAPRRTLGHFHMNGDIYRTWVGLMSDSMTKAMQQIAAQDNPDAAKQAQDMQKRMQDLKAQAEHVDNVAEKITANDHGVVFDVDLRRH